MGSRTWECQIDRKFIQWDNNNFPKLKEECKHPGTEPKGFKKDLTQKYPKTYSNPAFKDEKQREHFQGNKRKKTTHKGVWTQLGGNFLAWTL